MELPLHLHHRPGVPLYQVLAEAIAAAIEAGELSPGRKLPAARELAAGHCLSVATVMRAYEQLKSQGLIETRAKAGVFVLRQPPVLKRGAPPATEDGADPEPAWSRYGVSVATAPGPESVHGTAMLYTPEMSALPLSTWQKMLVKHRICYDHPSFRDYGSDPLGYLPLRQAMSAYLARSRSLRVLPENIVVTSYSRLDFFCRLLIDEGDHIAVENPSYPAVRAILKSHGAVLHPISVDAEGLNVDELARLPVPLKMVYLTPTHNDPTGAMLSLSRRERLVAFSSATNTLLWENHFDSHIRYTAPPLPSLFELAAGRLTVFSTSFWMALGPLVSLGFMAVPSSCLPVLRQALSLAHLDASALEASALADFIEAGHLEKQMHRGRIAYRQKRQALLSALISEFGNSLVSGKESCGFHLLLNFPSKISPEVILNSSAAAQLPLTASSPYYFTDSPNNQFLCPFMNLPENIEERVKRFAQLLNKAARI